MSEFTENDLRTIERDRDLPPDEPTTQKTLRNVPIQVDEGTHDSISGRGDPTQKYRIYRLCVCFQCLGVGKWHQGTESKRCPECRGEGKTLDLMATCATPQDVGCTLIRLGEEGEFEDCPIGILEDGGSWLVKPWLPSTRNVSDAGRLLQAQRGTGGGGGGGLIRKPL